ncbi:MAG: UDP binding domain-containing protein, partial [Actinomycetota bacterium]
GPITTTRGPPRAVSSSPSDTSAAAPRPVDIADDRETPSRDVVRELRRAGIRVVGHDPYLSAFDVDGTSLELVGSLASALAACSVAVVLQWHAAFDPQQIATGAPLVFDTRGRLHGPNVERL